jgi:hypothetical protein
MSVTSAASDEGGDDKSRSKEFFARARAVAATGHFDYAIELYLQGLAIDPEDVEGHRALREVSLRRKASGGVNLSPLTKLRLARSPKDPDAVCNAEKLLAYDPCNVGQLHDLLRAARAAALPLTAAWAEDVLNRILD